MTTKQRLEDNFINAAKLLAISGILFHKLSEAEQREFFEGEAAEAVLRAFKAITSAKDELCNPFPLELPEDPSLN